MFAGHLPAADVDPRNPAWRLRAGWAMDHVERQDLLRLMDVRHELHAGAVTYGHGQATLDCHWDQAIEIQSQLSKLLFPWLQDRGSGDLIQSLTAQWEAKFGSLDDPETQRNIEAAAAEMLGRAEEAAGAAARARQAALDRVRRTRERRRGRSP